MKTVLLVDASPMFREFLKDKLTVEKISVTVAQGNRDAFIKTISTLPDLIILEMQSELGELFEFLTKKHNDPNAARIPIIAAGPSIAFEKTAKLAQFGVVKYFAKPIKFDIFFEAIGYILKMSFSMDPTPCVLGIHRNGNVIFIEIAEGLNREKLSLLKYKLAEMIETENLESPKIILMMTNLDLSFVDVSNFELLLNNVLSVQKVQTKNVKVLSFSSFAHEMIKGHTEYDGIEVSTNLPHVLNSLIDSVSSTNVPDLITEKILVQEATPDTSSIETRFYSDKGAVQDDEDSVGLGDILRVALVDDDKVTLKLLEQSFKAVGATCDLYDTGTKFLAGINKHRYNFVVLDILMPGISGFDTLMRLQNIRSDIPVIIYSQTTQREDVIQALSLGAKRYIAKTQKPELVVQKVIERIHGKI